MSLKVKKTVIKNYLNKAIQAYYRETIYSMIIPLLCCIFFVGLAIYFKNQSITDWWIMIILAFFIIGVYMILLAGIQFLIFIDTSFSLHNTCVAQFTNFRLEHSASGRNFHSIIPNLYPKNECINRYRIEYYVDGKKYFVRTVMSKKKCDLLSELIERKCTVEIMFYTHSKLLIQLNPSPKFKYSNDNLKLIDLINHKF